MKLSTAVLCFALTVGVQAQVCSARLHHPGLFDEHVTIAEDTYDSSPNGYIKQAMRTSQMENFDDHSNLKKMTTLDFQVNSDNRLELTIEVNNEGAQTFYMDLYKGLSVRDPVSTYRASDERGWITATVIEKINQIQGVWYDALSGKTLQFSHVERVGRLLGEAAPEHIRELVALRENAYFVQIVNENDNDRCQVHVNSEEGIEGLETLTRHPKTFDKDFSHVNGHANFTYFGSEQCFREDPESHYLDVGIITDRAFAELHGNDRDVIKAEVENVVSAASAIYSWQFNVNLRIGEHRLYQDFKDLDNSLGQNDIFHHCGRDTMDSLLMLQNYAKFIPAGEQQAHWHLITNCFPPGPGGGIVGVANVGTAGCHRIRQGWHTGVSTSTRKLWLTFAHEVGHGLNMGHSFENGLGRTGGVMDYGNPYVEGNIIGFTPNRAQEACSHLDAIKTCQYFIPTGPTKKPTPQPTRSPTTRAPTTRFPTRSPTYRPTKYPTKQPTLRPTKQPTERPTKKPTSPVQRRLPNCPKVKFDDLDCPRRTEPCSVDKLLKNRIVEDTSCTASRSPQLWSDEICDTKGKKAWVYNVKKNKMVCTPLKKKKDKACCRK